jgi:hypothetical protein
MELINNDGNGKEKMATDTTPKEEKPKTHEDYLRQFSGELNEILSKGYPLTAVLQVLDTVVFELRMDMYMRQMAAIEQAQRNQKHIEIPHMKIPTGKQK